MKSPIKDIFKWKQHTLAVWMRPHYWSWRPRRWNAWSGQLVYRSWLCFEIISDNRADWLGDVLGRNAAAEDEK